MFSSKKIISVFSMFLLALSLGAKAETLSCNFLSSKGQLTNGFLTNLTAEFNCNGTPTQFIGDNIYVSCKPQFVLSKFTETLSLGEVVEFNVSNFQVSSIDGSSKTVTMVRGAVSASGKILEPQTIIQHGKLVKCNPTQVEVR